MRQIGLIHAFVEQLDLDSVVKSFDSQDAKVLKFVFWNRSLRDVHILEVNVFDSQFRIEGSATNMELTNC